MPPISRWALICAAALALAACDSEEEEAAPDVRPVRVAVVAEATGGERIALAGTVESQIEVDLAFRINGRLTERLVEVGDAVAAGAIVARLDPEDERNALRAAEAARAAASGQLSEARINYDRQRQLYERGFAARAAFERAEQVFQTAQASFDSAEAQVALARTRVGDTELRADAPGIVTAVGAEPGEFVQAGRMVVQLARDDGRDAVVDAPAALFQRAPADPEVTVTLSLDPSVTATGRVREVAPRADPVTGTFRVRIGLIDPPEAMRLGSTVSASIVAGAIGGIEIPSSALTGTEGEPAVWVLDPDAMTVSLRPVGIARFGPVSATVSDGLAAGEIVVTAGVQALRPGQEVRVSDPAMLPPREGSGS
jgi:RND family efflux transporter MFP subunit